MAGIKFPPYRYVFIVALWHSVQVCDVTRALYRLRQHGSTVPLEMRYHAITPPACVISRQCDLITFAALSRVTCVTQLHCLPNYFSNSAVKNEPNRYEPIRIISLLKILKKKFELSTTDEAGRVHAITVCANTSSEICDHMLALSPSDQLSSSLCVLLMY